MIAAASSALAAARPAVAPPQARPPAALPEPRRPAATAASRVFGLSMLLGVFGLVSAVFVITRLFESWRIGSGAPSHQIWVFGQRLSYPAANMGAIVVVALAALGLLTVSAAAWAMRRELLADRRFRRVIAARAPLSLHGVWVIHDERPQAFCAGLFRPRVYVSTGTLAMLDAPALAAVLAHERHHASRYDPLRLACGRALSRSLFFLPGLRRLIRRQHALAELGADEAAVITAGGDRSPLASALLSFSQASDGPALGADIDRIDFLIGDRPHWRFPTALGLGAVAALALVTALAVLAAHAATGSATLAPPFLSSQPCVTMLAMIPAAASAAAVTYARTRRTPQAQASGEPAHRSA
jgi:Zn-dependent protease with chaperone function